MKPNPKTHRGFTLVELLVVIVIIAALAGLTAPMVIRQRKKADQTEAVNNARQIGLGMLDFETEYSSFPDSDTAESIKEVNPDVQVSSTVSNANDAFAQLILAGITDSEVIFWCKTAYTGGKPDNVTNSAENTLEPGDVGFGYIMNNDVAYSTAGNTGRVLVAAPLAYTGSFSSGEFDVDQFDGKAVVLKLDNSVSSLTINKKDKKPRFPGGKELLEKGEQTVWGTTSPTMINPEPAK